MSYRRLEGPTEATTQEQSQALVMVDLNELVYWAKHRQENGFVHGWESGAGVERQYLIIFGWYAETWTRTLVGERDLGG